MVAMFNNYKTLNMYRYTIIRKLKPSRIVKTHLAKELL